MTMMQIINRKIQTLNEDNIIELNKYLDYLINQKQSSTERKLKFDWIGDLEDIDISSLELQKKAQEWRIEKNI